MEVQAMNEMNGHGIPGPEWVDGVTSYRLGA
jgi:hypothetical protein